MFFKEPTEVATYTVDWSDWLGDLTIATSTWVVPAGIIKDSDDKTDDTTLISLSAGSWGTTYELTNTITTSGSIPQTETRTLLISIQRSVAYCTPLEVRRRAASGPSAGSTSATPTALTPTELEALIEQASRMFDLECNVPAGYFNPVAIPVPTAKTIYGNGTNYLQLLPYIAGSLDTAITLPDGYTIPTFTEINGYLVINASGILPPFSQFHNCLWRGWQSGVAVTISAIWGYRETPPDVKLAVIELVINLWRETDPAQVRLINLEGQPLREKIPPRVLEIAKKYRFKTGVAFV